MGISCGKVILMGEHAAVYGFPAIAIPTVSLTTATSLNVVASDNQNHYEGPYQKIVLAFLNSILVKLNVNEHFNVTITSNIPIQRGMGSSAALFNSIVLAVCDITGIQLTKKQRLELVNLGEQITHGAPSGLDTATVINQQPTFFIKNKMCHSFKISSTCSLLIIDSGIPGRTSEAIEMVAQDLKKHQDVLNNKLSELGRNTNRLLTQLQHQTNPFSIGTLMSESHAVLKSMNLSTTYIDEIVSTCLELGAAGAKMTGGGLGGAVLAIVTKKDSQTIKNALRKKFVTLNIWEQAM